MHVIKYEYVFHIQPSCCDDYSNTCDSIYYWCLDNHPQHSSILDLFVGPVNGYLTGDNLLVVNDINNVEILINDNFETSIDIHDEFDFYMAEKALEYLKKNNPEKVKLFL